MPFRCIVAIVIALVPIFAAYLTGCENDSGLAPNSGPDCPSLAPSCIDYAALPHLASSIALHRYVHSVNGVEVDDGLAFVLDSHDHVWVYDVSDPHAPVFLTRLFRFGHSICLDKSRQLLIGASLGHVSVASYEPHGVPETIGHATFEQMGNSLPPQVRIHGETVYVSTVQGRLQIIDLSIPAMPQPMGSLALNDSWGYSMAASENLVYLADSGGHSGTSAGLRTIDASDNMNPRLIGTANEPLIRSRFEASGNLIVEPGGIWDMSDPNSPIRVSEWPRGGSVRLEGQRAYLASVGGLRLIDIDDPSHPETVGTIRTFGSRFGVDEGTVVVASSGGNNGCYLGIAIPGSPDGQIPAGSTRLPDILPWVSEVDSSGDHLYILGGEELLVVDASRATCPTVVSTIPLPDFTRSFALEDQHLWLAGSRGLHVLDIEKRGAPKEVFFTGLLGTLIDVDVTEDLAVLLTDDSKIHVLDASTASSPQLLGSLGLAGAVEKIAVAGGTCYAGEASGRLSVVDLSDPASPFVAIEIQTSGWIEDLLLDRSRLIVDGHNVFEFYDVSAPRAPSLQSEMILRYSVGSEHGLNEVHGNHLYVSNRSGVLIVDITTLSAPRLVGGIAGETKGYAVTSRALYSIGAEEIANFGLPCR